MLRRARAAFLSRLRTIAHLALCLACLVRGHVFVLVGAGERKRPGFRDATVEVAICKRCGMSAMRIR